ncbi:hypothetical protein JTB14_016475 [Gonioctena quinquepunctata]|nr:hypothetical protein JTB14_016475 [Gonioctena quinquepunctata]
MKSSATDMILLQDAQNRREMRTVLELITKYCYLNRFLSLIGITADPECRWCLENEVSHSHPYRIQSSGSNREITLMKPRICKRSITKKWPVKSASARTELSLFF